jgi:hypothetical protein
MRRRVILSVCDEKNSLQLCGRESARDSSTGIDMKHLMRFNTLLFCANMVAIAV